MVVAVRHQMPVRVRFDECGPDGIVRDSALLRYAQDVAWSHSEAAGFGREWYEGQGLTWLVRCLGLEVRRIATSGQSVAVSTEVVGWRRVWARRVSDVHDQTTGTVIATIRTDWVLLGPSGTPTRIPPAIHDAFPTHLPDFVPARVTLPPAPADAAITSLQVRRHELDPMGHANHAIYVDWMEEAVLAAAGGHAISEAPREIHLEYVRSAGPEMTVGLATWQTRPGSWACAMTDPDGAELLRGELNAGRRGSGGAGEAHEAVGKIAS